MGEAILQAEFVRDWFRACKAEGINTCLDTNGFVRHYDHIIDELIDVTDLVLLDLKRTERSSAPKSYWSAKQTYVGICKISAKNVINEPGFVM